jgi:hypothetical protein
MSEEVFNEKEYMAQQEELDRLFPHVGFSIECCNPDGLDKIITPLSMIILKNSKNCYCYRDSPEPDDYIEVKKTGGNITFRTVLEKLNDIKYKCGCNHRFLECIVPIKNSSVQFDLCFGS